MRERNLLHLFLALNVALAGAFVAYLILSSGRLPETVSATFSAPGSVRPLSPTNALPLVAALKPFLQPTQESVTVRSAEVNPDSAPSTNALVAIPVSSGKKFTWEQVASPEYLKYLDSLRAVGCPEEKVRYIILADINELSAKQRIKEAVAHDTEWWRTDPPQMMMVNVLQERGHQLDEERRGLITRLLGADAVESDSGEAMPSSTVQLTGEVLGSMAPQTHQQVQEICARAQRSRAEYEARASQAHPPNPVELARLRDQTRVELKQVLNEQEMEEFLLRQSHNAQQLRAELRGLDPTAGEFRKIFHALDPIEHQMQLQYGSLEALSEKQRERYQRQREDIIKETLGPKRFEVYVLSKDPLYRQAEMLALQYNAPARAILPIYQMTKANETRRQKLMTDPALTPQQKAEAVSKVYREQQTSLQEIASEARAQR